MEEVLALHDVTFKFAPGTEPFFKNLSVKFHAGKINFICGRNGIGKSVFLRLVQGNLKKGEIASGSFECAGNLFSVDTKKGIPNEYRKRVGLVCQKFDTMLADKLTFEENVRLANLGTYPTLSRLPVYKPLPQLLERFSIDPEKPMQLLSGGQRQIAAIIMMMQQDKQILLLDEPTSALDDTNAAMVMEFVQIIVQTTGITVLIVCHDKVLVGQYATYGFYELFVKDHCTTCRGIRWIAR